MRILLLGASGFIGRELFAALIRRGHEVVPAGRDASHAPPFAPPARVIDLNALVNPDDWLMHLRDIDALVNCAGILQATRGQSIEAVHALGPSALFRACEKAGVRRVVQISAISADPAAGTAYARTKRAGDDALRASSLDWVVLRPSLVHSRGAHGGTALFRALAALPWAIPVPGSGGQLFQPIWIDDLATVTAMALEGTHLVHRTIDPVGPETVSLRDLLVDYRRWLGLRAARVVAIPRALVALATHAGDVLGGPLNSTARAQLDHGNTGDFEAFRRATGIEALGWKAALAAHPAHTQDVWHARLYFAHPLLRASLALMWIASGAIGFSAIPEWSRRGALAMPESWASAVLAAGCVLDIALGLLVAARPATRHLATAQAALVVAYSAVLTALFPALWLDPLGPLLKNVPILAAIVALAAMDSRA